jgi:hypothetical protein
MEFLKANIISLYATGEAARLLEPLSHLLSFSDEETRQCREGLSKWKASDIDLSASYLGSLFGMR